MEFDIYKLLNIADTASTEEVKEAYQAVRKQHKDKVYLMGDEGAAAAKSVDELDAAYNRYTEAITPINDKQQFDNSFLSIQEYIKSNDLEKAQLALDNISQRDAEWHYIQALIFYRKNWYLESKIQLEMSLAADPTNKKYADTYQRLIAVIGNAATQMTENVPSQEKDDTGDCCDGSDTCCCPLCLPSACCFGGNDGGFKK